ncbi:translation initiation factor IF-1 [Haloferula chungangensis]|uniref:Translation initiation factor IF-1 n=1 Tax=Haloferula chungangensis TaxID=1048331 RepID=A0ABW2L308_9BACT
MYEAPILVTGEIVNVLKQELAEVRLPNGKMTLGHLSKTLRSNDQELCQGQTVELEMTPFDFDSGRIARILDQGE